MILSAILIIWIVGILLLLTDDMFSMYDGELIKEGVVYRAIGYSFWPFILLLFGYIMLKLWVIAKIERRGDPKQ